MGGSHRFRRHSCSDLAKFSQDSTGIIVGISLPEVVKTRFNQLLAQSRFCFLDWSTKESVSIATSE